MKHIYNGKPAVVTSNPQHPAKCPTCGQAMERKCPECRGFGGFNYWGIPIGMGTVSCEECNGKGWIAK